MTAPTADPGAPAGPTRRWSVGRVTVVLLVAAMVGMWVYVLYLAIGPGRQPPPDRLTDPTFAPAAQARCRAALDEVAALPSAVAVASATERAAVIDSANASFAEMLDDLEALAPAGEEGDLVMEWLSDWRTYLADRVEYAAALREDPEARLLVSPKDSRQITEFLDAFAGDNRMPACATPIDV